MARHRAQFTIELPDSSVAQVVLDALAIEAAEGPEGSTTAMSRKGEAIEIAVAASDVSTLRAAMHSALRLLDAAERTTGIV